MNSRIKYLLKGASAAFFSLLLIEAQAQSFVGAQVDNRAGIKGLTLNPANVVNPRLKAEIQLFSASAFIGNDYIGVNISDLSSVRNFNDFQSNSNLNPKPDNNFVGNVDILGPGFQLNLNPKNSIAFTTRIRGFFNLNNIGGELFNAINGEDDTQNFELAMRDLAGIVHIWGEIGATYGRVILDESNYTLRGGVTLKYLAGAGGAVGTSNVLGAIYRQNTNNLSTVGNLNYGYTQSFDEDNLGIDDLKSGFGADIGFIFELKDQSQNAYTDGYKLKAGISVMDLGSINYLDYRGWDYDMNNTVSLDEFEQNDLADVLEDNYNGVESRGEIGLGMPTSLQIFADYAITNRFYVSAHGSISLRESRAIPVSQVINDITITPRMEFGWLSVYSPLSYREFEGGISWGLGLRAGPVILGSGSILTNVLSKNSRSTDAYFGIQIPIYNKGQKRKN